MLEDMAKTAGTLPRACAHLPLAMKPITSMRSDCNPAGEVLDLLGRNWTLKELRDPADIYWRKDI